MIKSIFNKLAILAGLFLIYSGCESKPVSVDLGDLGYQIASQSLVADSSRTIIDQISHGNSSRLYVGAIDSAKHSSILIRVNKDILDLHADICSLPSDSIQYKSAYIYMNSISHFSEINGEEVQNQESNNQNEDFPDTPDLNKVRAFWMDLGETGLDWDESTNFTFAPDGDIIFGNSNVSLSQLEEDNKATELIVEYINSGLKIFFNSITGVIDDSSIIESLCSASSNNDFAIILNYNSENDLIEFYSTNYSSLSSQPYLNVAYDKYLTSTIPVNKFELDEVIPVSFNNNGFETVLDTTLENWGSVIALNFNPSDPDWMTGVPDSSLIAPIGYTDSTFELLSFHIRPIPHAADSSGTIIFYLSNVLLANADFDPSDDNFPDFENGTENNLEFDDGELFFDCGSDGICDADEPGYNPFGTEGNSTWDDNELFTDSGIDSLFSWEEPDYDPVFNPDPSGDDFNDDPSQDDWRDCGLDGLCPDDIGYTTSDEGELNDTWDPGEGTELNHRFDTDELYWDFGLDGIEDINEPGYHVTLNPDPNGDNWSISNPTGTEGNGTFDWIDINGNEYQDSDDEFEVFMDAGADTLWSYSEEGYNPYGKENNNSYDLGEPFEDCGIDQICDGIIGDTDEDDYVPDPVSDNFNNTDSTGTEGNGILDWSDGNGNNLWDEGEGEEWFDWGIDQLQNESEPYYGSRKLIINQSPQYFEWNYPEETETNFDDLVIDTDNGEEAAVWISSVSPVEGTDLYKVIISMHTTLPLNGFQLRLTHVPFMFSQTSFTEVNTSLWQIDTQKIMDDISLYNSESYPDSVLENESLISYGLNLKTFVDFYELDNFIAENPEAIISKAMIHFRIDTAQSNVNNNMVLTLNRLTDFVSLPSDTLPLEPIISMNLLNIDDSNELIFDIKSHIQNLSYGAFPDYGFVLEANHNAYNFSKLKIYNQNETDSLKPYLEILYSK